VLNGSKLYITNGPVADVLLVYAKTNREKGAHGISAFIIEETLPGLPRRAEAGEDGLSRSQTAELVLKTAACQRRT